MFSLGAVLYELLMGRSPRRGATPEELLRQARDGEINPPLESNPSLPPEVRELCSRCLAKDPQQRFASALELKRAIDGYLQPAPAAAAVSPPRRWPMRWLAAATAAVLAVAAPLGWWLMSGASTAAVSEIAPELLFDAHRELQHDFGLSASIAGAKPGVDGAVTLTAGQQITLNVSTQRDAYIGVWYRSESDGLVRLFPSKFDPDYFVKAGQTRRIPGEDNYAIEATPSAKPETLFVIASTNPWRPVAGSSIDGYTVFTTADDQAKMARQHRGLRNRGLKIVNKQQAEGDNLFSEVVIPFVVKAK